MSFLPYGGGSKLGWVGAFGVSGAVHGAVILAVLSLAGDFLEQEEDDSRTNFTVTLERLDADTLAGIVEQTGMAGAEGETEEGTDPDSLDPEETPPERIEPTEPDPVEPEDPAEPEVPEELEPEVPEALEPETVQPAEVPTPTEPEALVPDSVMAEAVTAVPVPLDEPELSPILPETVASDPLASTAPVLTPVAPTSSTVAALDANAAPPDVITPDQPTEAAQVVTAVNTRPDPPDTSQTERVSAAPPSEQDLALGDLIRRIRGALADPCLIALPRRDGEDGIGIAMIAAQDGAMENFAQEVFTEDDADIRQTRTLVDARQCPALTYIRQNADYPATRMAMRIDNLEITSGGRLTGVLRGGAGRYITLLLIDDNGVVQDLQRFMSFSGNLARFDVPVNRAGPSRDTSQLLVALGTRRPPVAIRERTGQLAQDVFAGLSGDLVDGAYLAIATFDVR